MKQIFVKTQRLRRGEVISPLHEGCALNGRGEVTSPLHGCAMERVFGTKAQEPIPAPSSEGNASCRRFTPAVFCLLTAVFCILLAYQAYAEGVKFPEPVGYVNDFAGVIPEDYQLKLDRMIAELHQKAQGAEVSVVTVQSIEPLSVEEYATGLFEKWGIGKKGADNGVLFLAAMKERKLRIEVGYGLEGALPDGRCGAIRDRFVLPYFKQGDFGKGIYAGTLAIIQAIAEEYRVEMQEAAPIARDSLPVSHQGGGGIGSGLLQFLLLLFLTPFIILKQLLFPSSRRGYYYSGGFGSSFGGFGGGFGGFGGGSSGGGGASGGW